MHRHDICRVCGYINDIPIWNDFGDAIIDEDCPCCGVQWGVQDVTLEDIRRLRKIWLDAGGRWVWPAIEPDDWDPTEQLVNIPREFR